MLFGNDLKSFKITEVYILDKLLFVIFHNQHNIKTRTLLSLLIEWEYNNIP